MEQDGTSIQNGAVFFLMKTDDCHTCVLADASWVGFYRATALSAHVVRSESSQSSARCRPER